MKILGFEEKVKECSFGLKHRKNMFLVTFENLTFLNEKRCFMSNLRALQNFGFHSKIEF